MKLTRLRFVSATIVLLATPLSALGADQITVAMLPSPTNAPFRVALDAGAFRDQSLEIVPVQFGSGTQSMMGLMSGDVQVTTTGGPAAINARLKGGNVLLFATMVGVLPYTFYVSDKIHRTEDLKAKKVGIAGFGGVHHTATGLALRKLGLAESDVTMVQIALPFANLLAAMASGSIQAALFQFPETKKANDMGFRPVLDLAQSGIKFPTSQMTTTREYLANNRDKVKRFTKALIAGLGRLKADKPFAMSVLGKFLGIADREVLSGTYDFWLHLYASKPYVDPEEIKTYLATLKDKSTARPEEFLDNSVIAELDRDGFIDSILKKRN